MGLFICARMPVRWKYGKVRMIMMMSTGWDYVFELRSPAGLLFISQEIQEHGGPWWNDDVVRGKLLNRPLELLGSPATSHLVASRRNGQKELEFCLAVFLFILASDSFTCRIILREGTSCFTSPPKECVLRILSRLKVRHFWWVWTPEPLVAGTLTVVAPRRLGKGHIIYIRHFYGTYQQRNYLGQ